MKKLPNSRTMLSFALALVLAQAAHTARAQEQDAEQAIAPPPPALFDLDTVDPDAPPPPPPSTQILNSFHQPNVQVPRGFRPAPVYKATDSFARRSYQDRLDVCVNAVAQACDGHFTRKLTRALARGTRDVVDGTTLANALRSQGITKCGHYVAKEGGLEMEAFVKGTSLVLFSLPSPSEKRKDQAVCKHSVIPMPETRLLDMKVTENRAWVLGATGTLYYVGANFQVHDSGKKATSLLAVSPDGSKIGFGAGLVDANSVTTNDTVKIDRDKLAAPFSDDVRVSDAAADLVPAVNQIRR